MNLESTLRISILNLARGVNQFPVYKNLRQNQFLLNKKDIEEYWERKSKNILKFHFENNKVYRDFLYQNGIDKLDKCDFKDIPIIGKETLRYPDAILKKEVMAYCHSGGSSGIPFSYSTSYGALVHLWPNLWRAFSVAGYMPGEKLAMIAGPSLFGNRSLKRKIYDYVSNFEVLSAFDMNESKLHSYYKLIKENNIKYIYGYTSAILIFLDYLRINKLHLKLKGIFTTSETIITSVYFLAKEYCDCDVFDIYGANDGGILAFECEAHDGYHISSERTHLEIIDNNIILTDLLNTSFPFIRYKVGDMSSEKTLIKEKCTCGRSLFRLKHISGRVNSYIEDLDNKKIHTQFFSHVFYSEIKIKQFQIINEQSNIIVNIIPLNGDVDKSFFDKKYLAIFKKRFKKEVVIKLNLPVEKLTNQKTPILIDRTLK
tara:strand:- start:93 stop:1379 length:1287 start_codon:yes stop_codon:yes gene_type:complete